MKRALARYLVPKDYQKSIRRHEKLGSSVIRKIIMGTAGRLVGPPGSGGNYRLDHSRSPIEAATEFAFRSSVFNEAIHTAGAAAAAVSVTANLAESGHDYITLTSSLFATVNIAAVALQRYNRARMAKRIDEQLQMGATYRSDYQNWTGIDSRAVENFHTSLPAEPNHLVQSETTGPSLSVLHPETNS